MKHRTQRIRDKGFAMEVGNGRVVNEEYLHSLKPGEPVDYSKIQIGLKSLDNALLDLNFLKTINPKADKESVLRAINSNDVKGLRELSDFFYRTSGIYRRLLGYMAGIYRLDWYITPVILDTSIKKEKIVEGFFKSLVYTENFKPQRTFGAIALKVVRQGAFYGYKIQEPNKVVFQELPIEYCRSRFSVSGKPAVEFNMRYFDDMFRDTAQKLRILEVFPTEFQTGYIAYKQGKLTPDFQGDQQGWYLLDVKNTVKFNINGDDTPMFVSVIPAILDLIESKELDRKKMIQQLLKVIIQQMPLDKDGDLIFDVDEAKAMHNNAVSMLGNAIGVDVLTTFADVEVADLSDRNSTTSKDELMKVERSLYNEAGVSQMQFNTDGNIALEKSIANDEASILDLVYQFEDFLNELLEPFNKNAKKLYYKAEILNTTIYNYKELSKLYKEQMQIGFSMFLPQVALGQSQLSILAGAYFENEILDLNSLFVPPASSATTSGDASASGKENGRPPKPDEEKSTKTIANKESMN